MSYKRNLAVGIVSIIGIIGLGWLILKFGTFNFFSEPGYTLTVHMDHTSGVGEDSRVRLNGLPVGFVTQVKLREDPTLGVVIICDIEPDVRVPESVKVSARGSLLSSATNLDLTTRTAEDAPTDYLPTDGSAVIEGRAESLTDMIRGSFEQELSNLRGMLEPQVEKFGLMAEEITKLSQRYSEVGEHVQDLIEPRDMAQVDAGKVEANLRTVIVRADQRLREIQSTIDAINALVGDEQMREDLKQTVADARATAANARQFTEDVQGQFERLTRRYVAVADELTGTLQRVDSLVENAQQGEGTIGRLMQDPSLYESLDDAAKRMNDTLRELQLLIEKWKAEGLPIQL